MCVLYAIQTYIFPTVGWIAISVWEWPQCYPIICLDDEAKLTPKLGELGFDNEVQDILK